MYGGHGFYSGGGGYDVIPAWNRASRAKRFRADQRSNYVTGNQSMPESFALPPPDIFGQPYQSSYGSFPAVPHQPYNTGFDASQRRQPFGVAGGVYSTRMSNIPWNSAKRNVSRGGSGRRPRSGRRTSTDNNASPELREQILHQLSIANGHFLSTSELLKRVQCHEKKDLNRVLYKLSEQGLIKRVQESPPLWMLDSKDMQTVLSQNTEVDVPAASASTSMMPTLQSSDISPVSSSCVSTRPVLSAGSSVATVASNAEIKAFNSSSSLGERPSLHGSTASNAGASGISFQQAMVFDQQADQLGVNNGMLNKFSSFNDGQILSSVSPVQIDDVHRNASVEGLHESDPVHVLFGLSNASDRQNVADDGPGLMTGNLNKNYAFGKQVKLDQPYIFRGKGRGRGIAIMRDIQSKPTIGASSCSAVTDNATLQGCQQLNDSEGIYSTDETTIESDANSGHEQCTDEISSIALASNFMTTEPGNGQTSNDATVELHSEVGNSQCILPQDSANDQASHLSKLDSEKCYAAELEDRSSVLIPVVVSSTVTIPLNPPNSARKSANNNVFRRPLSPKHLLQCDSRYAGFDSPPSPMLTPFDADSYSSLPDNFGSLSCSSKEPCHIQRSQSMNSGLGAATVQEINPFAAALGIEREFTCNETSDQPLASNASMASGLLSSLKQPVPPSLTGESFAALNKNSVSALMEYAQSRHLEVEIKCINSFGPSHRPV